METIKTYFTKETLENLRKEGFKVVGVRPDGCAGMAGAWYSWQEVYLERGKKSVYCHVDHAAEVPVEAEPQYFHTLMGADHVYDLERILALPELTVKEEFELEWQQYLKERRRSADDKTWIYVFPSKAAMSRFSHKIEKDAICICNDLTAVAVDGRKIYNVIIPKTDTAHALYRLALDAIGRSSCTTMGADSFGLRVHELKFADLLNKICA